jgi:hypothetical protein
MSWSDSIRFLFALSLLTQPIPKKQHLYRRSLKNALDWYVDRPAWRQEALNIRAEFERYRNIRDPRLVVRVIRQIEKKVEEGEHPDPYIRELGFCWMRSRS